LFFTVVVHPPFDAEPERVATEAPDDVERFISNAIYGLPTELDGSFDDTVGLQSAHTARKNELGPDSSAILNVSVDVWHLSHFLFACLRTSAHAVVVSGLPQSEGGTPGFGAAKP